MNYRFKPGDSVWIMSYIGYESGIEAVVFSVYTSDKWDNAIREFGVGNACEWFGYSFDGAFAQDTLETLQERYEESLK